MGSGYPGAGGAARQPSTEVLAQTVGELGDELQRLLREKIQSGDYGEILVQLGSMASPPAGGGPGSTGFGGGYPGRPGGGYPGAWWRCGTGLCPVPGMSAPGFARRSGGAVECGTGAAAGAGSITSLMAGVSLLGKGSSKELLKKAADQGIDVLVVFEVEVTENRKTSLITNETRIVVYDVATGESIEKSKSLNNITIQKFRAEEEKDEEDPVTSSFDKIFTALDSDSERGLKMRKMPAEIRPEHVQSRVAAILASEDFERLPALAEIKFFCHRGLVSSGLLEKSFQKVLGEAEGAKLASGTEDERVEVISTLLPREK